MRGRSKAIALLLAVSASCASPERPPYNINVLHDLGSDIEGFRTWDWTPDNPHGTGGAEGFDDDFIDACMRAAIERELARRGYRRAGGEAPDFLPDFLIGYRIDMARVRTGEAEFDPGDVTLIAWDTSDGEVAWAVTVHGEVKRVLPPEERKRRIDEALRVLLDELRPLGTPPPEEGGG